MPAYNAPPGANQDANYVTNFLTDIPPVTRFLFVTTLILTPLSLLGIIPLTPFAIQWSPIIYKFQIWRPFLSVLNAGRLKFDFLWHMYFLYTYSAQLERAVFFGRAANYAWMIAVVAATSLVLSAPFQFFFLGPAIVSAIVHVWGRHAQNATISIYGIIQIPGKYLSLALVALDTVIKGALPMDSIAGVLAGHLYYFLDSVYPLMPQGKNVIFVPSWFERAVAIAQSKLASITGLSSGPPEPAPSTSEGTTRITNLRALGSRSSASSGSRSGVTQPTSRRSGHDWGKGHTLGSS